MTASVFSLGNGEYPTAESLLPSDALVIVIQDRSEGMALPLLQRHNCHHSEREPLTVLRHKAEKAYSKHLKASIPIIDVSI
jgi:hypothetical protein